MKLLLKLWLLVLFFISLSGVMFQFDLNAMGMAFGTCAFFTAFSIPTAGSLGYFN